MQTTPGAGIRSRLSDARRELAVAAVAYVAYEVARLWAVGDLATALANGRAVLHLERALGLNVESLLNGTLGGLSFVAVASCYFYATAHYLVTPAVLVWMYHRHRDAYGPARTALLAGTAAGFLGQWLLPTAPPRMLPGFHDTMAAWSSWGWWGGSGGVPSGMEGLANPVAAMPSLHVGWAAWCGWCLFRYARSRALRIAGLLYPLATTLVVIATANHYLLDAVAGVGVMAVGGAVAWVLQWRPPRRSRRPVITSVPVPRDDTAVTTVSPVTPVTAEPAVLPLQRADAGCTGPEHRAAPGRNRECCGPPGSTGGMAAGS